MIIKNSTFSPGSVDWSIIPYTKMIRVRFPVRAHTQVVHLVRSQGAHTEDKPMDISPSLSLPPSFPPSLPPSLSLTLKAMKKCSWVRIKEKRNFYSEMRTHWEVLKIGVTVSDPCLKDHFACGEWTIERQGQKQNDQLDYCSNPSEGKPQVVMVK